MSPKAPKLLEDIRDAATFIEEVARGKALPDYRNDRLLRQALGLKADDQLIAETTPEGLLLRPAVTLPVELYTPEREREFDEAEAELANALASAPARPRAAAAHPRRQRRRG